MGGHTGRILSALLVATAAWANVPVAEANHLPEDDRCPDPGAPDHWDSVVLGNIPLFVLLGEVPPGCFVHPACHLGADPCEYEIVVYINGTGVKHGTATRQDTQETHECGPTTEECKITFRAQRANDLQVTCGTGLLTTAVDVTLYCRNHVVGPA